jgi:thiol-disulfide isomerase/thioredoxin
MNKHLSVLMAAIAFAAGAFAQTAATPRPSGIKVSEVQTIANGQEVKLANYLAPGRTTIFDFYSEYCPPCRALAPQLDKLHKTRQDIVVVKVNINRPGVRGIDWKSSVARQYDLHSVPHLKVFGPDGKLKAEGKEARTMVGEWIGKLGK